MANDLNLGDLKITLESLDGEPVQAVFDLPDGSTVKRNFPQNGELTMRLGLGLGLSHQTLGAPPALSISGTPVLTATEDEAYAGFTVSASGGEQPYTYSLVGTWPAGITINSSTGEVSGTPTESGTFTGLSVRVTDGNSDTADLDSFTIEAEAGGLILDGLSPTGAWSMSRDLLSAFVGGSRYTDVSGAVSSLNDQSGNSRHLAQGTAADRPMVATAGPNNRTCADFVSTDRLVGPAISNFIANNSGYMVVSVLPDTISTNNANAWTNQGVLTDGAGALMGLYLRNTDADVGDPDTIQAYNWDGSADVAASASIIAGTAYVVEWKHEAGNVSVRVNGGSWVDVASGNTTALTGLLSMGTGNTTGAGSLDGKVFEAAVFSTVPGSGDRDAIVADFMDHIGI